jgi:hypothetical protein
MSGGGVGVLLDFVFLTYNLYFLSRGSSKGLLELLL